MLRLRKAQHTTSVCVKAFLSGGPCPPGPPPKQREFKVNHLEETKYKQTLKQRCNMLGGDNPPQTPPRVTQNKGATCCGGTAPPDPPPE